MFSLVRLFELNRSCLTIIPTILFKPCIMLQFYASNFALIHIQCQFLLPFVAWQVFILDPACKPFSCLLSLFRLF